jgi:replicative DNA helicase
MEQFDSELHQSFLTKYLPHNFVAEKSIISNLLQRPETIEIAIKTIRVETFYFKNHQEIYKALIEMYKNQIPVDIFTLSKVLHENGYLHKIGGTKVLLELMNQIPNLTYLEEYIQLVQEKFLRRSLIRLGYEAINSGHITSIPFEEILDNFEKKSFNLTNELKSEKMYSSGDIFSKILSELKQKSLKPELPGLASGFYDLDSLTQGFQKSDLIIIAGRPSMGKTAFSLNITQNLIKNYKLPILFFSLEMSKEQLIYRLLSTETGISQNRLKIGNLYKEDWTNLELTVQEFSRLPLFIEDKANLTTQDIRLKIKNILFEYNQIGLIVIDYLQLMQNSKSNIDNRVQELSEITRSLKNIAKEFQVPIIALSQLSRNVETRVNKRPILSDLRESGSIEQDADLVLMLYREDYYNPNLEENKELNSAELIIAKHRNGPLGTIKLLFQLDKTKFLNNFSTL